MEIDHDSDEQNEAKWREAYDDKWLFVKAWLLVFVLIGGFAYLGKMEWYSFAVGGVAGITLATWAIEVTGNKIPSSWVRNARRGCDVPTD